jgi:hypothetical protein
LYTTLRVVQEQGYGGFHSVFSDRDFLTVL